MPSENFDKIRLKFNPKKLPLNLEYALIHVHGFTFTARKNDEWVIYEKFVDPPRLDPSGLSEDTITELTRKVNKVANSFEDPEAHKNVIKIRCTNLARTLPTKQRAWVLDWIKRVIDEDGDDPPWEDDKKYCLNLGAC